MRPPKVTNSNGVRFLHNGPSCYAFAVKIEIGCKYGKHGKTRYIYIGDDKDMAIEAANEVNEMLDSGISHEEVYQTLKMKYRHR